MAERSISRERFNTLKSEILENNNTNIKHLIKLDDILVFVKGIYKSIDGYDYLYTTRLHPAIKKRLEEISDGIFFGEKYNFEEERKNGSPKYEYIIKIEDKEKYYFSEPLFLDVKEEYKGKRRDEQIMHSGYYGSSAWTGLSFNKGLNAMNGFLSNEYIPMLKGETIRREYRGGRWDKLYGFTEYTIIGGDEKTKDFIIQKNV